MYKIIFLVCFLINSTSLLAQEKDLVFGLQSGVNYNKTFILTEFENTPLRSDFFIGSSFGVVARKKITRVKWSWGGLSNKLNLYAESGLNWTYGGYNYYYQDQATFQEQMNFQIPLLLVWRADPQRWEKRMKKKKLFVVGKAGFTLSTTAQKNIQKQYTFGEAILLENINIDKALNIYFTGTFGIQKEFENGKIIYIGFSSLSPFFTRIQGTIEVQNELGSDISTLSKGGNFFSIDLQYFFGERTDEQKAKRGKMPKIIFNPRY